MKIQPIKQRHLYYEVNYNQSLLAVALVFRSKLGFDGIDHVIDAVSVYADSSVELPLSKACKFGSVTLLDRIWNSTIDLGPHGRGMWSVRKLLRTYRLYGKLQFTLCLLAAIKIDNVGIVQWMFEHFPDYGVRRKVVYEATAAGALEILRYFRANGTTIHNDEEEQEEDGEWDEEKENWESGRWVHWGDLDAARAALAGHTDVVRWMYDTDGHEDRNDYSTIDAAFITGNMELAHWVMDRVGMAPEGPKAPFGAAANGHVEALQWFQDQGNYTSWDAGRQLKQANWTLCGQLLIAIGMTRSLELKLAQTSITLSLAGKVERGGRISLAWVGKRLWLFMPPPSMAIWMLPNIFLPASTCRSTSKKNGVKIKG